MPDLLDDTRDGGLLSTSDFRAAANTIKAQSIYLKDRITRATIYPIFSPLQVPVALADYLAQEYNDEIARGQSLPFEDPLSLPNFQAQWFGGFAAIMLKGEEMAIVDGRNWADVALGTFFVQPNYPGRSSHICTAGFLVVDRARKTGVGKLLADAFLDYAPKLGYTYTIFDLVYENNIAALKIFDTLGFKRIGKIKGAGRLKDFEEKVDAVVFGRDLGEDDEYVTDERFIKIRYYLEKGKYPPSANRSEKSRLRSAATHYRLDGERLMLKDKEVISDPQKQYEIARSIHSLNHGGINKTTASIAEKYHWVQIKKTVLQVIKNCSECKDHSKPAIPKTKSPKITSGLTLPLKTLKTSTISTPSSSLSPQPPGQHHRQLAQAIQSQHEAMANVVSSSITSDLMHDLNIPVDPNMMNGVQSHLHHNLAPVPQMHDSLVNVSLATEAINDHHIHHHRRRQQQQQHNAHDIDISQLDVHHLQSMTHTLHDNPTTDDDELMLDDPDDSTQRHVNAAVTAAAAVAAMSDGDRDQFEQQELQRLVAELKSYQQEHDEDDDDVVVVNVGVDVG